MADIPDKTTIEDTIDTAAEKVYDLPATKPASAAKHASPRLFGREKSVHELFGSGKAADIVLWRQKHLSIGVIVVATLAYAMFEWAGFTLFSVVSNTLLFVVIIVFIWSNIAALLNRPPPPVPNIQLSEEAVEKAATTLHVEINRILAVLRDVALGRDFKLFLKVLVSLYLLSVVGGWFDVLTLTYIAILAALSFPVLYEKYEDEIEMYVHKGIHEVKKQHGKIHELVLSKIPRAQLKEKKVQ